MVNKLFGVKVGVFEPVESGTPYSGELFEDVLLVLMHGIGSIAWVSMVYPRTAYSTYKEMIELNKPK